MTKTALRLSAAIALVVFGSSSAAAAGSAKLRLPPSTTPKNKIYSAQAVAGELEKRGYRIESMKRHGDTYSVRATGPRNNKVQLTVDGRSGDVVGLAVLQAAADMVSAI